MAPREGAPLGALDGGKAEPPKPEQGPEQQEEDSLEERLAARVRHFQAISEELHEACTLSCKMQRELWREESAAKREGRRIRKGFIERYMKSTEAIDLLRRERGLHATVEEAAEFIEERFVGDIRGDRSHFTRPP